MNREVLVKVGFITGTKQAFDDAQKMAGQASKGIQGAAGNAGQAVAAAVNVAKDELGGLAEEQGKKGNKKGLVGSIENGLKALASGGGLFKWLGLAGAGAATIGKIASDVQMSGMQGGGLRGHGLSGMVHDIKDFFTGRGTKEAMQDFNLMKSDFATKQFGETLERAFAKSTATREASYKPITEVDPLKRQKAELALIRQKQKDTDSAADDSEIAGLTKRAGFFAKGKDRWNNFEESVEYDKIVLETEKDKLRYKEQLRDLSKQELAITAQQLESKKETIRGGKIAFGQMTAGEQEFAIKASERYKSGAELHPTEIAALRRTGFGDQAMNDYAIARAEKRGVNQLAANVGDPDIRKAAAISINVGGKLEANLDATKEFDKVFEQAKDFTKKIEDEIDMLRRKTQKLELDLHNKLNVERKLQIPGG